MAEWLDPRLGHGSSIDPFQPLFDNIVMYRVLTVIDDYNELVYLQTLLKKLGFDVEGIQSQKKFENIMLAFNPSLIIASAQGRNVDGLSIAKSLKKNKKGLPTMVILRSVAQVYRQGAFDIPEIDEVLDSPVNVQKLLRCIATYSGMDEEALSEKYAKFKGNIKSDPGDEMHILSFDKDGNESQVSVIKGERPEKDGGIGIRSLEEGESVEVNESHFEDHRKDEGKVTGPVSNLRKPIVAKKNAFAEDEGEASVTSTMPNEERRGRFKHYLEKMEKPEEKTSFPRDRIIAFNKKIRSSQRPEDHEDLEVERKNFVKALFKK